MARNKHGEDQAAWQSSEQNSDRQLSSCSMESNASSTNRSTARTAEKRDVPEDESRTSNRQTETISGVVMECSSSGSAASLPQEGESESMNQNYETSTASQGFTHLKQRERSPDQGESNRQTETSVTECAGSESDLAWPEISDVDMECAGSPSAFSWIQSETSMNDRIAQMYESKAPLNLRLGQKLQERCIRLLTDLEKDIDLADFLPDVHLQEIELAERRNLVDAKIESAEGPAASYTLGAGGASPFQGEVEPAENSIRNVRSMNQVAEDQITTADQNRQRRQLRAKGSQISSTNEVQVSSMAQQSEATERSNMAIVPRGVQHIMYPQQSFNRWPPNQFDPMRAMHQLGGITSTNATHEQPDNPLAAPHQSMHPRRFLVNDYQSFKQMAGQLGTMHEMQQTGTYASPSRIRHLDSLEEPQSTHPQGALLNERQSVLPMADQLASMHAMAQSRGPHANPNSCRHPDSLVEFQPRHPSQGALLNERQSFLPMADQLTSMQAMQPAGAHTRTSFMQYPKHPQRQLMFNSIPNSASGSMLRTNVDANAQISHIHDAYINTNYEGGLGNRLCPANPIYPGISNVGYASSPPVGPNQRVYSSALPESPLYPHTSLREQRSPAPQISLGSRMGSYSTSPSNLSGSPSPCGNFHLDYDVLIADGVVLQKERHPFNRASIPFEQGGTGSLSTREAGNLGRSPPFNFPQRRRHSRNRNPSPKGIPNTMRDFQTPGSSSSSVSNAGNPLELSNASPREELEQKYADVFTFLDESPDHAPSSCSHVDPPARMPSSANNVEVPRMSSFAHNVGVADEPAAESISSRPPKTDEVARKYIPIGHRLIPAFSEGKDGSTPRQTASPAKVQTKLNVSAPAFIPSKSFWYGPEEESEAAGAASQPRCLFRGKELVLKADAPPFSPEIRAPFPPNPARNPFDDMGLPEDFFQEMDEDHVTRVLSTRLRERRLSIFEEICPSAASTSDSYKYASI
ncbi:hypothetical protein GOP47_0007389 [Adiantum capillus-veneris]|uniref:Uncharacterized protein n=1 Tax=Adiantum capillus-veneris TaxID=13818 RepID=A0A9D4V0L6_ADICA|nr:hypothetical protein GOP47_0007389 [Adiantum capillus-veneris]